MLCDTFRPRRSRTRGETDGRPGDGGDRRTDGRADAAHAAAIRAAVSDDAAAAIDALDIVVDVGNGVGSVTADALVERYPALSYVLG